MRNLLFAFAVFLGILLSFHLVAAVECGQTPTDHCTISTSTTFTPGTYQVENLTIIANDTVIDCNGAQFNKLNALLFVVDATEGVTIQNCYMSGYARAITGGSNSVPPFPSVLTLTVRDNIFDSVWTAVYLIGRRTVNNTRPADPFPNIQIVNNTITNAVSAIKLINEDNNIITDNTIQVITQASNFEAIVLAGSSNSLLLRNTIDGGKIRIQRDAGKNATNATIEENVISDSPLAIELLQGADGARVRRNIASRVDQGMSISYSSDHYIRANAFSANELIDTVGGGISIEGGNLAQNITIFLNYFENLSDPVFDGGFNNSWDNNITLLGRTFSFGNFYQTFYRDNQTRRGFACVDLDFDNICDNPYLFDVNVRDNFPIRSLSGPDSPGGGGWSENTPVVEPIQPFMISEVGQIHVLINATSPLNLSLSYSVKNDQGQLDERFVPVPGQPHEFIWETDLLSAGNYTFYATATDALNFNGGIPFEVQINDAPNDCQLYLPRIVNGCEIQSTTTFSPGTYILPHGISITADNIVLDCNGAVLDSAYSEYKGITVTNRQNVEIKNCVVQNNGLGLLVDTSNDVRVHDSTFSNSIGNAVSLINSQNIQIQDNILTLSEYAVRFSNVQNSLLYRNQLINNENGQIDLIGSSSYNNITENNMDGIQFNRAVRLTSTTSNNLIYRNNFKNYISNSVDDGTNNVWTVNGEGNYWDDWSSQMNGPRVCINNNWDTLCENPYQIRFIPQDTAPFSIANGWERPYPQITVSTTTPQQGQPMTIQIVDPDMAGQLYFVVGDIFTGSGLPMGDGRIIDLAGSGVFFAMVENPYTLGFSFSGIFDQQGVATITWNIPQIPGLSLSGVPVYFNILPFNPNLLYPQAILRTYRSPGVVIQ